MRTELIKKKKKILKRISVSEYRELLAFVEDVYLADYSLKILLARKCSNLFFALLELMLEEDGARVRRSYDQKFSQTEKPIIISDRAISYYSQKIKDGGFKKILIVDDVIIHGRTIFQLYEKIQEMTVGHEITIDVQSYAANENNLLEKPCIQKADVWKKVSLHAWRAIVDTIIDVLYLAGQPYTSYVPNIVLNSASMPGRAIKRFVQKEEVCILHNEIHSGLNLYSYAWIDPDPWKFALFQSVRIYMNEDLSKYVLAPMVSILPIHEDTLFKYREILKGFILPDYYEKMFQFSEELNYRAIVYVISSLWSRFFFRKYADFADIDGVCENPLEEEVNFGSGILDQGKLKKLSEGDIVNIIEQLGEAYKAVDTETLMGLSRDFIKLGEKADELAKNNSKEDTNSLIQHFLCINGDLDEDEWEKYVRKETDQPMRLAGYPFSTVTTLLAQNSEEKRLAYSQSLKAIDFGKGSIIVKKYRTQKGNYFVSLLHAGEQNYKYREEKYFPYLYGLFEIERMAAEKGKKDAVGYKQKFMDAFKEQFKQICSGEAAGYETEELQKLCRSDITTAFKTVLINDAWSYPKKDWLDFSIELADNIMNNGDCVN